METKFYPKNSKLHDKTITTKDFHLLSLLKKGKYYKLYVVKLKENNKKYILKVIKEKYFESYANYNFNEKKDNLKFLLV